MKVYEIGRSVSDDFIEVRILYKTRPQVKIRWTKLLCKYTGLPKIHRKKWQLVEYNIYKKEVED